MIYTLFFVVLYMTVKIFLLGVLFRLEPKTLITHKLSAEGNKELSFNKHPCSENSLIHVTDTKDFRSDPRINTVTRHIFLKEFLKFWWGLNFVTLACVLLKSTCSTDLWSKKRKTNMGSKASTGVVKWLVICQIQRFGQSSSPSSLQCPLKQAINEKHASLDS